MIVSVSDANGDTWFLSRLELQMLRLFQSTTMVSQEQATEEDSRYQRFAVELNK